MDESLVHEETRRTLREDLKFSFNQGYRDIHASLSKMEDLAHDISLCKIQVQREIPPLRVADSHRVWYRKIVI